MNWTEHELLISDDLEKKLHKFQEGLVYYLEQRLAVPSAMLDGLYGAMTEVVCGDDALHGIVERARRGEHQVVHLVHESNWILNLPWLMACDRDGRRLGECVGLHVTCGLPGMYKAGEKPQVPVMAPPLKILMVVSCPEDLSADERINFEREEREVLDALRPLLTSGQVQVDYTFNASLEAIREKLSDSANRYHVLHFSGHASFTDRKGSLLLEDYLTFRGKQIGEEEFANALVVSENHRPPLIVLSCCQSARGENDEGLRGITNHLIYKGFPAVIGMGMSISDFYASQFTGHFYGELARKQSIPSAFKSAQLFVKDLEERQRMQNHSPGASVQWLIPNLYVSQPVEHLVNWESQDESIRYRAVERLFEKDGMVVKARDNQFRFVGRKRDLAKAMKPFFEKKTILLKGQGGVGKSTLAEYMIRRLMIAEPRTEPFVFSEGTRSVEDIIKILTKQLMQRLKGKEKIEFRKDLECIEEAADRIGFIIDTLSERCVPLFVFDNLESYQGSPGGDFKAEYSDLRDIIAFISEYEGAHVILTGRYSLPEVIVCVEIDLNRPGINDFIKKCLDLNVKKLEEIIHTGWMGDLLSNRQTTFLDIIEFLYKVFGGNYRALEWFDRMIDWGDPALADAVTTLEAFKEAMKDSTDTVKRDMKENLAFTTLFAMLTDEDKKILRTLSHFRIPVLGLALVWQGREAGEALIERLNYLNNLTLIEVSFDPVLSKEYYYVTPLVGDILGEMGDSGESRFSYELAGKYHYYMLHNFDKLLSEAEEAFYHYYVIGEKERVCRLGEILVRHYYAHSFLQTAYFYGEETVRLVNENLTFNLLNMMGVIYKLVGQLDKALHMFTQAQIKVLDKEDECTILNNISQIYVAQGEYKKALRYLKQNLTIWKKIGDKQGELATLINMANIAHAQGDYPTAITYINQSLIICLETGDKEGEGIALNHLATIAYKQEDYPIALFYFKQSLGLQQQIGDKYGEARTLNNISQIYKAEGEAEEALGYLERSLVIQKEIVDKQGMVATWYNMALITQQSGDNEKYVDYLGAAFGIAQEIDDAMGFFHTGAAMGGVLYQTGRKNEGLALLREVVDVGKRCGFPETAQIEELLAGLLNESGK